MDTYLRILKFIKPYWLIIITAFFSSLFFALFNASSLWVVGTLIGTIMGTQNEMIISQTNSSTFIQKIESYFNSFILGSEIEMQLKIVCFFLIGTFLLKNIFYFINWICLSIVELKIITDIRQLLFSTIQKYQLSFFDKTKSGEIISIMLNDVTLITIAFNKTFQVFFHETISMLILTFLLFSISTKLSLIVLIIFPIAGFLTLKIGQSIKRKTIRSSLTISEVSNIIIERISNVKIVKAFNMTLNEIKNFSKTNIKYYNIMLNQKKLTGLITPLNDIIGVSLAAVLLWVGGQQVLIIKDLSPDDFMRFIIFLFALLQPARKLSSSIAAVQSGIVGAERVFSLLDLDMNKKNINNLVEKKTFDEKITVENLNFFYDKDGKQILNNINAKIYKGQKIALVGASGSGKTTFANLLLDFYSYDSGEITLDTISYKKLKTTSIRNIIGLVSQEPILFNDTIKNNIAYGSGDVSFEKIKEAAKIANIYEYISSIKDGFDTVIGERGVLLSGGQKQRLSIARAILRDPPILIFDEATSSLDSESEKKVQNAIDNLIKDRTVLMIAHRLSTIKNADKIFVFNNGQIVEEGTHDDLYNIKGYYFNLYNMQYEKNNE